MKITRTSLTSGVTRTKDIDITQEQLERCENENIQNVIPHLSANDREFLITGMVDFEWDDLWSYEVPEEEHDTFEAFDIEKGNL